MIAKLLRPTVCVLALVLAGCTSSADPRTESQSSGEANPTTVRESPEPTASSQSGEEDLIVDSIDHVPFDIGLPRDASRDIPVIATVGATSADFPVLGETEAGFDLPGPSVNTVMDDGVSFGGTLRRAPGVESGLESIPRTPGIISPQGAFTPLSDIGGVTAMRPLPGSNPEDLYFESQHATSNGEWVVWREGSAGTAGAMPTLDSDDWRIVAWNRRDGRVTEMASAFLLHGDRFAPRGTWDVAPSTDGRTIYFEAPLPNPSWHSEIIAIPLDRPGEVTSLYQGTSPAADPRGGVFWLSESTVMSNAQPIISIAGDEWQPVRTAASDRLLAVTVTNGEQAWILIWDLETEALTYIINCNSDWAEVSIDGDAVVWGNATASGNSSMYYWSPGRDPVTIGDTPGLSTPRIGGGVIAIPAETEDFAIVWRLLERPDSP